MRPLTPVLCATLVGLAVAAGLAGCAGRPPTAEPAAAAAPAAPRFGLLQAQALHYLIDRRTEGGQTLLADATVYSDGRIVVTATLGGAIGGREAWLRVRLSDAAGRTLFSEAVTTPYCLTRTCPSSRQETWTLRTTPRLAARATNLWLKLDIRP